jgi:molybdopterin-guanine dinucleotide biosynthesis protein A
MSTPSRRWPHTGAIVAGGASSRMGRPKADLILSDGRTMAQTIAATLSALCDRVVIVGQCEGLPHLVRIDDRIPGLGPVGGIDALLASDIDDQYLICPCDTPMVTTSLLKQLLDDEAAAATVFQSDRATPFDPLPCRLRGDLRAEVQDFIARGGCALWKLMERMRPRVIPLTVDQARLLANINTPGEYRALVRAGEPSHSAAATIAPWPPSDL